MSGKRRNTDRKICMTCGERDAKAGYIRCSQCRGQQYTFDGDRMCTNCGTAPLKRTQKAFCSRPCMFRWRASVKLEGDVTPWPESVARQKAYGRWRSMMSRCYRPENNHYHRYGARGITVCARWQTFDNYYADLGDPPAGMSLDRIDNDGAYSPENTRWATPKEQRANVEYEYNKLKTCCPQGHPYAGDNLYVCPKGRRSCRTCQRAKHARYRAAKKQSAVAA